MADESVVGQERNTPAVVAYRVAQLERWKEGLKEDLDLLNDLRRLDVDKVIRLAQAYEAETSDKRELNQMIRNTIITMVVVGFLGPVLVLLANHFLHL